MKLNLHILRCIHHRILDVVSHCQSNKVETFDKPNVDSSEPTPEPIPTPEPEPQPEPTPEPQSFWSKIGCFFKTLFGGSC